MQKTLFQISSLLAFCCFYTGILIAHLNCIVEMEYFCVQISRLELQRMTVFPDFYYLFCSISARGLQEHVFDGSERSLTSTAAAPARTGGPVDIGEGLVGQTPLSLDELSAAFGGPQ